MSDFDKDIKDLLNAVLEDKPVIIEEKAAPSPKASAPDVADDSLSPTPYPDEKNDGPPHETEGEDAEVLDVESMIADITGEDPPEKSHTVLPTSSDEDDSGEEDATVPPQTAEHVFSTPSNSSTGIPMPQFTTDEIADELDIRNFATLVTLNTARWHAKVKDRKAAKDAADASGADAAAFEARKRLLVGADEKLKRVHKAIDTARTEHYRLTLPWSTVGVSDIGKRSGGRLMPNTLFMEYTSVMAKCKADMDKALTDFVTVYPTLVTIAQGKLGQAFNPSDYPNPSSIKSHFDLSFDFNPIPVGGDFKGLQDAQIQKLGSALNKKTRTMLENAMQDAWKRLYDAVLHAYQKLNDPDAVFHYTLIEKLIEQSKMLKHLNATSDTRIEEVRQSVERELTKHSVKDIRKDDALRKLLASKAKLIHERMKEIGDE